MDWIVANGLLSDRIFSTERVEPMPGKAIFDAVLFQLSATWIHDADLLIQSADDIPIDLLEAASATGIQPDVALRSIRRLHGQVELEARTALGKAGELALVDALNKSWPGRVRHDSLTDDGLGYDVTITTNTGEWHLEIKSTRRLGRLRFYLSRNEFRTAIEDTSWRLVLVALDPEDSLCGAAVASLDALKSSVPIDQASTGRWESVRLEFNQSHLNPSLDFLGRPASPARTPLTHHNASAFSWVPCDR
jgi:hypothetical protein